ncbi:hypothetical protein JXM67_15125 [candidate division WOR-3 bacterium]|nr:hypothetical protein [candidate division WOR-3 bacterium]
MKNELLDSLIEVTGIAIIAALAVFQDGLLFLVISAVSLLTLVLTRKKPPARTVIFVWVSIGLIVAAVSAVVVLWSHYNFETVFLRGPVWFWGRVFDRLANVIIGMP